MTHLDILFFMAFFCLAGIIFFLVRRVRKTSDDYIRMMKSALSYEAQCMQYKNEKDSLVKSCLAIKMVRDKEWKEYSILFARRPRYVNID